MTGYKVRVLYEETVGTESSDEAINVVINRIVLGLTHAKEATAIEIPHAIEIPQGGEPWPPDDNVH
jgi:hypothetical protein